MIDNISDFKEWLSLRETGCVMYRILLSFRGYFYKEHFAHIICAETRSKKIFFHTNSSTQLM